MKRAYRYCMGYYSPSRAAGYRTWAGQDNWPAWMCSWLSKRYPEFIRRATRAAWGDMSKYQ